MKNKISLLLILLVGIFGVSQHSIAQTLDLSIPNDLMIKSQPTLGTGIRYNVTLKKNQCVNLFGANSNTEAKKLSFGNNDMTPGIESTTIAVLELSSISNVNGSNIYNFGTGCAEDPADGANVTVMYSSETASSSVTFESNTLFELPVNPLDIKTVNNSSPQEERSCLEDYLRINAGENNTATISIQNDAKQGQAFVMIFAADNTGTPLAKLNPKSSENLSFTVAQDVYIVPIIKPKQKDEDGNDTVIFEIGDPEQNGKIIIEEM